jgi:hypothetical protein
VKFQFLELEVIQLNHSISHKVEHLSINWEGKLMKSKLFKYPFSIRFVRWLSNFMAIFMIFITVTSILPLLLPGFRVFRNTACDDSLIECGRMTFGMMVSILILLCVANYFPEIEISEDGLIVEYLWYKLQIPWDLIGSIRYHQIFFQKWWVVQIKKFALLHVIYGVINFRFPACIIINARMIGSKELTKEIQRRKARMIK